INRCHEASIDARPHVVRENVGLVFDRLDGSDVVLEPIGLSEQLVQQSRSFLESLREFVEENEKPFVAWYEAHGLSSEVAEATRRSGSLRGRRDMSVTN